RRPVDAHVTTIHLQTVGGHDAGADTGHFAVDRDAPGRYPGFHGAPRPQSRLRQNLLQFLTLFGSPGTRTARAALTTRRARSRFVALIWWRRCGRPAAWRSLWSLLRRLV